MSMSISEIEKYDDTKPVRVWLGNLAAYNAGHLRGAWLSLPMDEDALEEAVEVILNGAEEYIFNDYETDIEGIEIGEHGCVFKLNEKADKASDLDADDQAKLYYLTSYSGESFDEALDKLDEVCLFCGEAKDYVYDFVDECYNLPDFAMQYFDYDSLKRDMECSGEIVEFRLGGSYYTVTNANEV